MNGEGNMPQVAVIELYIRRLMDYSFRLLKNIGSLYFYQYIINQNIILKPLMQQGTAMNFRKWEN